MRLSYQDFSKHPQPKIIRSFLTRKNFFLKRSGKKLDVEKSKRVNTTIKTVWLFGSIRNNHFACSCRQLFQSSKVKAKLFKQRRDVNIFSLIVARRVEHAKICCSQINWEGNPVRSLIVCWSSRVDDSCLYRKWRNKGFPFCFFAFMEQHNSKQNAKNQLMSNFYKIGGIRCSLMK